MLFAIGASHFHKCAYRFFDCEMQAKKFYAGLREDGCHQTKWYGKGNSRWIFLQKKLTPGDIIMFVGRWLSFLQMADLIEANHLPSVMESSLTGESLPTVKNTMSLTRMSHWEIGINMLSKSICNEWQCKGRHQPRHIPNITQLGTITSLVESSASTGHASGLRRKLNACCKKAFGHLGMTLILRPPGIFKGKDGKSILETFHCTASGRYPEGLTYRGHYCACLECCWGQSNAIVKKLFSVENAG